MSSYNETIIVLEHNHLSDDLIDMLYVNAIMYFFPSLCPKTDIICIESMDYKTSPETIIKFLNQKDVISASKTIGDNRGVKVSDILSMRLKRTANFYPKNN